MTDFVNDKKKLYEIRFAKQLSHEIFHDCICRNALICHALLHKLLQKKVITPCLERRYFSFFVG